MINYILFDDNTKLNLLPFTHTRPIADIRCGILTFRERWEMLLKQPTSTLTDSYLQTVFPLLKGDDNILINGAVFGNEIVMEAILNLKNGENLIKNNILIAARVNTIYNSEQEFETIINPLKTITFEPEVMVLKNIWDIFSYNDKAIRYDFELITQGRQSAPIPDNILVTGKENIFIEQGGQINMGCIINATKGPVYIGKDAELLEGVMIHGPFALGEHGVVKMGAKIYGATTVGPNCKVGGEISNVVFFANCNNITKKPNNRLVLLHQL